MHEGNWNVGIFPHDSSWPHPKLPMHKSEKKTKRCFKMRTGLYRYLWIFFRVEKHCSVTDYKHIDSSTDQGQCQHTSSNIWLISSKTEYWAPWNFSLLWLIVWILNLVITENLWWMYAIFLYYLLSVLQFCGSLNVAQHHLNLRVQIVWVRVQMQNR